MRNPYPLTPGRLLLFARRDWARGWRATWHDYITSRWIVHWCNPHAGCVPEQVPVHVLTGSEQFILMLWMLAGWFHHTGRNWRVVVHDDGTLTPVQVATLRQLLPEARCITATEADSMMASRLAGFPHCAGYRARHPLARKIFDVPAFAESGKFILLDADLVFFARPTEMLDWVDGATAGCWFNQDVREASLVGAEEARQAFGIDLWPQVNSGLCLLDREALDITFCEQALQRTTILEGRVWRIEQTLFALCAARYGHGGLLPSTYEVSLGKWRRPDTVCRHYVGAVRERFFAEGVPELRRWLRAGSA